MMNEMASIDSLQFHSLLCNPQSLIPRAKLQTPSSLVVFRRIPENLKWVQVETNRRFVVCKAIGDSSTPDEEIQNTQNDDNVATSQSQSSNIPNDSENSPEYDYHTPSSSLLVMLEVYFLSTLFFNWYVLVRFQGENSKIKQMKKVSGNNIWIGVCVAVTVLVAAITAYVVNKSRDNHRAGSVADLVRRGQLRSGDRRGISKALSYEDPFNNPFVKVGKGSSTIVTLTDKAQTIHQKRRPRAYEWKRPTVFLKEG